MTPQRLKQPIPMAKSLIFQMQCLNSLKEKFAGLSGAASLPESGNITSKASSADSASSHAGVFDPMVVSTAEQTSAPTSAAKGEDKLDSSEFVPQFFEE